MTLRDVVRRVDEGLRANWPDLDRQVERRDVSVLFSVFSGAVGQVQGEAGPLHCPSCDMVVADGRCYFCNRQVAAAEPQED